MNIGIETSALGDKFTGTGRYINCLLSQLRKSRHDIKTFSPKANSTKNNFPISRNVFRINHGGIERHFYRQFILAGELKSKDTDCAFFPNYFMPPQFDKTSAVVIHDLSFVTHPQFYSKPFVIYYNQQLKSTLRKNPIIVTVSEHSREQIQKNLGIKREDIFLVQPYSNFNKNNLRIDSGENSKPYFLYVGHVEPRKNLQFLIENFIAWNESKKANFKLVIAGELWIRSSSTIKLLKEYKNNSNVEFTGYVEEEKLKKLYSNAAALLHTSFVEGFGLPVLEAMHYGLPIICSKENATEEISYPGSIAIDPYSSKSFRNGLNCLYEKITAGEKFNYEIKYSPELTCRQLNEVLDLMEIKSKNIFPSSLEISHSVISAVEKTLLYANLFNAGIKKDHLLKSLFDVKTSKLEIEFSLTKLLEENKITIKNNSLYLNAPPKRYYQRKRENYFPNRSLKFLMLLKNLPLISSISFSGGTANYGIKRHDDIDLFIITKPNCVFIVYAVIHLLSLLFRLRRQICANYLIDEMQLEISSPRDFYTANQIISLLPYKNKKLVERFIFENRWINYFYPNFPVKKNKFRKPSGFYFIFFPFNKAIMIFYKLLYRKHLLNKSENESLKISNRCLKLHTNDHRVRITNIFAGEWKKYCEENYSNKNWVLKFVDKAFREKYSVIQSPSHDVTKIKLPA